MQDDTTDRPDAGSQRSAPAAEADVLGEAARNTGTMDRLRPKDGGRTPGTPEDGRGEAQPGQDENQAGFVKDPDKKFSP